MKKTELRCECNHKYTDHRSKPGTKLHVTCTKCKCRDLVEKRVAKTPKSATETMAAAEKRSGKTFEGAVLSIMEKLSAKQTA